jgi:hypothetical protein
LSAAADPRVPADTLGSVLFSNDDDLLREAGESYRGPRPAMPLTD